MHNIYHDLYIRRLLRGNLAENEKVGGKQHEENHFGDRKYSCMHKYNVNNLSVDLLRAGQRPQRNR